LGDRDEALKIESGEVDIHSICGRWGGGGRGLRQSPLVAVFSIEFAPFRKVIARYSEDSEAEYDSPDYWRGVENPSLSSIFYFFSIGFDKQIGLPSNFTITQARVRREIGGLYFD
jgi:hypothetical protein